MLAAGEPAGKLVESIVEHRLIEHRRRPVVDAFEALRLRRRITVRAVGRDRQRAHRRVAYDGTARLTYRESIDRLAGYYYTGPARASEQDGSQKTTYGTMEFTRESNEPQK